MKRFTLALLLVLFAFGCATTRDALISKTRWKASIENQRIELRVVTSDRDAMLVLCKLEPVEIGQLDGLIGVKTPEPTGVHLDLRTADEAWQDSISGLGVESNIADALDAAKTKLKAARVILNQARERPAGCRPPKVREPDTVD